MAGWSSLGRLNFPRNDGQPRMGSSRKDPSSCPGNTSPTPRSFAATPSSCSIPPGDRSNALPPNFGVSAESLRAWRNRAISRCDAAQAAGRSEGAPADPAAEIRRLQREVDYLPPPARDPKKSREHTLGGPAERYALIDAMRDIHSISELCEALGVSRSGYHAARKRPSGTRACENLELLIQMRTSTLIDTPAATAARE